MFIGKEIFCLAFVSIGLESNINAKALFYTEVGDVTEFLNQETGRYGIDRSISIPKAEKKP